MIEPAWYPLVETMLIRTLTAALLALLILPLAARPLRADEVHLTNGETFEGVVAEVQGDKVAIRMPNGVIRLPRSRVERVEKSASPLEDYLRRAQALAGSTDAGEWLELALWARDRGLHEGVRSAALRAARLDPQLDGLAPLMHEVDHVYDEELGRWIHHDDLMSRRGYLEVDGRWVPPEVVAEAARQAREERQRRVEEERSRRIDQAINLLALAQIRELQEDEEEEAARGVYAPYGIGGGAPVAYFPGGFVPRGHGRGHHPRGHARGHDGGRSGGDPGSARGRARHTGGHNTGSWDDVARHQPGSIIPIASSRTTSGRHDDP